MKYEKAEAANTQRSFRLIAERIVKVWHGVLCALHFHNIREMGAVVDRPKSLGDIRGVTYIYGMFYRFGLIDVPDEVKEKMKKK